MSTVTSSTNPAAGTTAAASTSKTTSGLSADSAKAESERFLKLLVTQLQNQDPMNPVDNAQMTSQMAQISTVSGIEKLNTTVQGMTSQFMQMQVMQGASLVGHSVIVKSDKLSVPADGVPTGMFQIDAPATAVKVEVLSKAGNVIDTMNLGAQPAGRNEFQWPAGQGITEADGVRFRVTASSGTTALTSTALMQDKVDAVNTSGSTLTLELARSGDLSYSSIVAVN